MYGLSSILVNALALWIIPPLIVLGGVGALIGLVIASLGDFLIWICQPFLWWFEFIVNYFGSLSMSLQVHTLSVPLVIGYYVLFVFAVMLLRRFRSKQKPTSISLA